MKTTINYGLKKPEGTDVVNIEDLNYNADMIDQKIKEVDTKASNIKVPVSSVNGKTGAVTLAASDIGAVPTGRKVNNKPLSSDITLSATDIKTSSGTTVESQLAQKATKAEVGNIDDATLPTELKGKPLVEQTKQLFQYASEGKQLATKPYIGGQITPVSTWQEIKDEFDKGKTKLVNNLNAKGVTSSKNDSLDSLATKVGGIGTGYEIVTGKYTTTAHSPTTIFEFDTPGILAEHVIVKAYIDRYAYSEEFVSTYTKGLDALNGYGFITSTYSSSPDSATRMNCSFYIEPGAVELRVWKGLEKFKLTWIVIGKKI